MESILEAPPHLLSSSLPCELFSVMEYIPLPKALNVL